MNRKVTTFDDHPNGVNFHQSTPIMMIHMPLIEISHFGYILAPRFWAELWSNAGDSSYID